MNKKFSVIVCDPPFSFLDKLQHSDVARGAAANYSTMSISEIKQLPVNELADPEGALLALWVPSSLLQEGLDIMKVYGFAHKQTYIWVKNQKDPLKIALPPLLKEIVGMIGETTKRSGVSFGEKYVKKVWKEYFKKSLSNLSFNDLLSFGMGRLFRQCHEICLIGINNNKIYKKLKNKSQRSVSFDVNFKHSAKPDHLQNSLDIMFSDPSHKKIELFARKSRKGWICLGNESPDSYGIDIRDSISKLL